MTPKSPKSNNLVSVIIPIYNEEKVIGDCLTSLAKQTYKSFEVILVDDGSSDRTIDIIKTHHSLAPRSLGEAGSLTTHHLLRQQHKGPGIARNLGATHAKGEILVFVDADMTFDKNFIKDLVTPILESKTIGTFSKNELNANSHNIWSRCWNINRGWPIDRLIPPDYPNEAPVYRAILKKEFAKVGGFDTTGEYTDDWSLSRKLGIKSTVAKGAIYYHANPSTLGEVWRQARWIGKNEFISGNLFRRFRSLVLYSLPISMAIGIYKSIVKGQLLVQRSLGEVGYFLIFKLLYDLAVWTSVVKSFFGEKKAK